MKLRSLNLDERWALRRSSSFSERQQPMTGMTSATWFETELSGMGGAMRDVSLELFLKTMAWML